MRKNEPVTNIMSKDVISAEKGQPLSLISQVMNNHGIHHVPVVNASKLVGIVSLLDMMKLHLITRSVPEMTIGAIIDKQYSIEDVMISEVVTVNQKDTIRAATEILSSGDFHSLPVVDDDNLLVGIVTSTDLIRYLSNQY